MKNKRLKQNQDLRTVINWCRINKGSLKIYHWKNKAGVWSWCASVEKENLSKEAYAETMAEAVTELKGQLHGNSYKV
jgi:wobble nucleotide-excising tRNase